MINRTYQLRMKTVALTMLFIVLGLLIIGGTAVDAQSAADSARQGIDATCEGGACPDGETGFRNIITSIVGVLSLIVGAVSVIMIIIGGLRYTTSSGDSSRVTAAKNTILYAIIGLLIAIFAQYIVQFVVGEVSG